MVKQSSIVYDGMQFACNRCDYKSLTNGNVKKHIKSKHEGVRYACYMCDQQYSEKSNLRKHIETKHGSKKIFM